MDLAGDNVAGDPREGRLAALHHAIHLIAAVNLGDACTAFGAGPRICLDHLGRLHRIGIAGMRGILLGADYNETIGTRPFLAGPTLVGGGEKATTVLIPAFHHKLAACGTALGAVVQLSVVIHVMDGSI